MYVAEQGGQHVSRIGPLGLSLPLFLAVDRFILVRTLWFSGDGTTVLSSTSRLIDLFPLPVCLSNYHRVLSVLEPKCVEWRESEQRARRRRLPEQRAVRHEVLRTRLVFWGRAPVVLFFMPNQSVGPLFSLSSLFRCFETSTKLPSMIAVELLSTGGSGFE